ncbi:hypothetical protein OIE66_34780 [Nonomuraea sp. NBC_01738]|uniref:hypothetical protein n=1 Tax=Nonomuraea sp. NBC_01738 TaxID=2976003 RepID=UPI002E116DD4|nr:hypothetical protein OIE66_34780 [Nonomuraea sp. NBC_01738]
MSTALLFAQLKFRLIAGNLRGDVQRKLGFAFTLVAAVCVGGFGFLLMSLMRLAEPGLAADLTVIAFTVFFVSWAVVPLLAFGVDDTLDPARLALFPLRTRELAVGMFTASATGVWPAATLLITAGALVGLATGPGGVLLGVVAVLLQFALCLVISRLTTTALSSALRSRRGRDVLAVAAIFVVLLFQLPNLIANRGFGDPAALIESSAAVLRWTPPGLAAHAIADGGLAGVADLVALALVVLLVGWLWIKALGRALVTADASTQAASVRRSSGIIDRFLPDGPLAAVVTKELKYITRDPRYRIGWFASIVVTGVIAFSIAGDNPGARGPMAMVAGPAALGAMMLALQTCNAFGIDGRSLWMNAMAFGTERGLRTDLAGRHVASALIAVPLLTVLVVAVSLFAGNTGAILPALLIGWGVFGVGLGVGSMTSVLIPYTVPDRINAFTGAAPGQGGQAFAGSFAGMIAIAGLSLPVVLPVVLGVGWVAVAAVPYGIVIEILGRRLASSLGYARLPEVLAAVSRPT